jgi:hypothetical protein
MTLDQHGNDDADQPRRIEKHGPTHLTGVVTMDGYVMCGLAVLVALPCPGQAQMLSWCSSGILG